MPPRTSPLASSTKKSHTQIEIDRQVETQISGISSDNFLLKEAPEEKIQEQMRNFSTLEELVFGGKPASH